jgi:D-sedoheptulose 7-phosphate isomerase
VELQDVTAATLQLATEIDRASALAVATLEAGGKILACGNGGSAAEAQHFVTELVGRYLTDRRPLPAVWLGGDTGQMTCIANDFSPDEVFSRPLAALASPHDLLLVLSSSGKSRNVIRCLEAARAQSIPSIALLGKGGGPAAALATIPIIVPSPSTARVQEMHLLIVHVLCDTIEARYAVERPTLTDPGEAIRRTASDMTI